jgi:hypothetical protein
MNDQPDPSSPRVSGARIFTLILLGLFCVTAAVFIFLPQERISGPATDEDPVFLLNEVLPGLEYPGIPGATEPETIPEEQISGPSQTEVDAERMVFTVSAADLELAQPEVPVEAEGEKKKIDYNLGFEDTTRQGSVRASNVIIGVDYKVSENATVGVAASQGIHDSQDAAAWGGSSDDETAAHAKYKLAF